VTSIPLTFDVHAKRHWNATGLHLTQGARYRATVVPGVGDTLKDASFTAGTIAGEDWKSWPPPWVIADGGVFTVPATGELVCYFNDVQLEIFYRNNSGWVRLQLDEVSPRGA